MIFSLLQIQRTLTVDFFKMLLRTCCLMLYISCSVGGVKKGSTPARDPIPPTPPGWAALGWKNEGLVNGKGAEYVLITGLNFAPPTVGLVSQLRSERNHKVCWLGDQRYQQLCQKCHHNVLCIHFLIITSWTFSPMFLHQMLLKFVLDSKGHS